MSTVFVGAAPVATSSRRPIIEITVPRRPRG
jgi:hypothetical protein